MFYHVNWYLCADWSPWLDQQGRDLWGSRCLKLGSLGGFVEGLWGICLRKWRIRLAPFVFCPIEALGEWYAVGRSCLWGQIRGSFYFQDLSSSCSFVRSPSLDQLQAVSLNKCHISTITNFFNSLFSLSCIYKYLEAFSKVFFSHACL